MWQRGSHLGSQRIFFEGLRTHLICTFDFIFYMFYWGRGKERVRKIDVKETSVGCLQHALHWGSCLQPVIEPPIGIEPATFWCTRPPAPNWATTATGLICRFKNSGKAVWRQRLHMHVHSPRTWIQSTQLRKAGSIKYTLKTVVWSFYVVIYCVTGQMRVLVHCREWEDMVGDMGYCLGWGDLGGHVHARLLG